MFSTVKLGGAAGILLTLTVSFGAWSCDSDKFMAPSDELQRRLSTFEYTDDPRPVYEWVAEYHGEAPGQQMMIEFVQWGNGHPEKMNRLIRNWPSASKTETLRRIEFVAEDTSTTLEFETMAED